MRYSLLSYFIATVLFSHTLVAADIGLSVRALGMGNAYTAVVNDHDSIFYNPAGLARMSGFAFTVADPAVGMNNIDSYQRYVDLASNSSNTQSLINELYGEDVTLYAGAKSIMSFGSFAFGAYGVTDSNFLVNNPVFPNIDASYRVDYGFVAAWGFEVVPKMLSVGVQSRRVQRQGGTVPIGVSTIASLDTDAIASELDRKGVGYAFDVGATLSIPGPLQPTLSFTWRDLGDTAFEPLSAGTLAPGTVRQEQIIGLGMTYESLFMDIRPALDFRFLNDGDKQLGKKINLGVELSWPIFDVRGGFSQGYYTLGTSFDLWLVRFDVATYGVELGVYPGQLEDRRYMMQISFEFGVDPGSFSLFKLSRPSSRNPRSHSRKLRR